MPSYIDQMGRTVRLKQKPCRIISLVPSQTELLYDLGADECVVGITKFCIHPTEWFRSKARVGGTKTLDFNKIESLQPDLIIGNKEENEQLQIEELMQHYPVWMSDIKNLNEALAMIASIGEIIEDEKKAQMLINTIKKEFEKLKAFRGTKQKKSAAYIIWNDPIMSAGTDTFINEMLNLCGYENVFNGNVSSRYPELTIDELKALDPEFILLSSEPFPFKEKHAAVFSRACPKAEVKLVDGELFSWYGSRLKYAPEYFLGLGL